MARRSRRVTIEPGQVQPVAQPSDFSTPLPTTVKGRDPVRVTGSRLARFLERDRFGAAPLIRILFDNFQQSVPPLVSFRLFRPAPLLLGTHYFDPISGWGDSWRRFLVEIIAPVYELFVQIEQIVGRCLYLGSPLGRGQADEQLGIRRGR